MSQSLVSSAPLRAPERPLRILVADDDAAMRKLVCTALRHDGYDIVEARDGHDLLEQLANMLLARGPLVLPDAIVSDIRMPGGTGLQARTAIRHFMPETPVILITGFGDDEVHRRSRHLGANAVFDKPFDVDDLRTALLHLLRETSKRRR